VPIPSCFTTHNIVLSKVSFEVFYDHVNTGMQVVSRAQASKQALERLLALSLAALMYEFHRFSSKKRNTVDELTARIQVPKVVLYNPVGSYNVMHPTCNLYDASFQK